LKDLLNVEFVYEEDEIAAEEDNFQKLDLSQIFVPETLFNAIFQASEEYSITQLEKGFEKLKQLDEIPNEFKRRIEELFKIYDMEAITKLLKQVSKK